MQQLRTGTHRDEGCCLSSAENGNKKMKEGIHTVVFCLHGEEIARVPRSRFNDPYFPVTNELLRLNEKPYLILGLHGVANPQPGELYVSVREAQ